MVARSVAAASGGQVRVDSLVEEDVAAPLSRRVAKVPLDFGLLDRKHRVIVEDDPPRAALDDRNVVPMMWTSVGTQSQLHVHCRLTPSRDGTHTPMWTTIAQSSYSRSGLLTPSAVLKRRSSKGKTTR